MSENQDKPMAIKVSIVDDNEGIRSSLATLIRRAPTLKLLGEYADAETAVKEIPTKVPDVVLMDINLPGMNGIEATRRLQEWPETREIPVIALSAAAMLGDAKRVQEAGFYRYLTKPVRVDDLARALEELLLVPEAGPNAS